MKPVSSQIISKWEQMFTKGEKDYPKGLWYRTIEGLRKTNIRFLYTQDEITEVGKCIADKTYFMSNYGFIRNRTHGDQLKFKPYKYQEDIIKTTEKFDKIIINSARQMGLTTIMLLDILYQTQIMKEPCIVLAHNKSATRQLYEMFTYQYMKLPFFMKQGIKRINTKRIEFEGSNRIIFATVDTFHPLYEKMQKDIDKKVHVYISDFQFIRNTFMLPIMKTVLNISDDHSLFITGKVSPHSYFFNRLVLDASRMDGDPLQNKYKLIQAPFWQIETRDTAWVNQTIKDLGSEAQFRLEYDIMYHNTPHGYDHNQNLMIEASRG